MEREYEVNKSKTLGPIFKILKKFDGFKSLLFYILFITFFFQKPQWCSKTEGMSPDCNKDKDGNIYYVSKLLALPPFVITYSNFITWSCMFILIVGDVLSVLFIGNWTYKLRVVSMMIMFAADVVFTALTDKIKFFLFEYNLGPFFRIIFMILYNTGLRNSMKRLISTMTGAYEALLTFLLNLAIWSGFAFILFQGKTRPINPIAKTLRRTTTTKSTTVSNSPTTLPPYGACTCCRPRSTTRTSS